MAHSLMPGDERFSALDPSNTTALMNAIDDLCQTADRVVSELEGLSMLDIYRLAVDSYGSRLPEFWRIWHEWNQPGQFQSMGDL